MNILPQPTQAESDQKWLESLITRKAEAMHHFASVSQSVNDEFWGRATDDVLRVLNADIARSLAIMQSDLAVNVPINAGLNAINLPQFSKRAPTGPGRGDITFNGTAFVYVAPEPPAEIEPLP